MNRLLRPSPDCTRLFRAAGALALAVVPLATRALETSGWQFRQDVQIAAPGMTKIALPADTLDRAQPALTDLRVLGPAGQEVPYLVETPQPSPAARIEPKSFTVRLERLTSQITIETGVTSPIDAVELATSARAFVKPARIEVSADGGHWTALADGRPLTRESVQPSARLALGGITAAYLRITLDDWRSSPVPFTGALLQLSPRGAGHTEPVDATIVKREEFVGESVLTIDLHARHLPLAEIAFDLSDPIFSRDVTVTRRVVQNGEATEAPLGTGRIERSRPGTTGAARESVRLPLTGVAAAREIQIHLMNGQSPPLSVARVIVRRRPVWLNFHAAEPGAYSLLTGNPRADAPRYDLARFAEEFRSVPPAAATIGSAQPNSDYRQTDPLQDAPWLGANLDITPWKYHRQVTPADDHVQELELDLAALAHARSDLGDLRLMRGAQQIPYVLERTSSLRPVPLTALPEENPSRPRVSRWRLPLPLSGAPLQHLKLDSTAPLFSRSVRVFERITDRRGEPIDHPLAAVVQWQRSPGQPATALTIPLISAPDGDAVIVEMDNGDNSPIALHDAQAAYRVTRLLFRSDGRPVDLYYGREDAAAPAYDLQLVAPSLVNDTKSAAALGAEENTSGRAGPVAVWLGGRSGVLLWAALALVVVVLLLVIARLLPKPPPGGPPPA